jgi:hypothetical protein
MLLQVCVWLLTHIGRRFICEMCEKPKEKKFKARLRAHEPTRFRYLFHLHRRWHL